jgi:hypothetical protein
VYILQHTVYQLYKLQPFPIRQQENVFVYIATKKDFMFTDAMRHKYGKMTYQELQTCLRLMHYHMYVKKCTYPQLHT